MRLDKALASSGLLSRKEARQALRAGRVQVNGLPARDGEVDPNRDEITLDGRLLTLGPVVLMLHKPAGYVTSTQDPRDRTVMELVPEQYRRRVTPVGRLDKQTEGLLLLTDDGQLAHRLISPRHRVAKVYYARHGGQAGPEDVQAFAQGLVLADGSRCLPALLEPLGPGESRVTVCQGMYHQVRRMLAARGLTVSYLARLQEGGVSLGDLPKGQCRLLTPGERQALFQPGAEFGQFSGGDPGGNRDSSGDSGDIP